MRLAIQHVTVYWDKPHYCNLACTSWINCLSPSDLDSYIINISKSHSQWKKGIKINRSYCLPVKGEGRNNPATACYRCIATEQFVSWAGEIDIYRNPKLINFLNYNATKTFFIQTTFYLYYLYKLFKEDIHKLVFKQKNTDFTIPFHPERFLLWNNAENPLLQSLSSLSQQHREGHPAWTAGVSERRAQKPPKKGKKPKHFRQ